MDSASGQHPEEEMPVFNMGLGMLVVVSADQADAALAAAQTAASRVGVVKPRSDGPVEFTPVFN